MTSINETEIPQKRFSRNDKVFFVIVSIAFVVVTIMTLNVLLWNEQKMFKVCSERFCYHGDTLQATEKCVTIDNTIMICGNYSIETLGEPKTAD